MRRAINVKTLSNYLIVVSFDNGENRVYNCYPLLEKELYSELKNEAFFKTIHVDEMGLVCWDDSIDIEPHELYENSIDVKDILFDKVIGADNLQTQTIELVRMLPEEDLALVNSLIKRLLLLWDPDFIKTTSEERADIDMAIREIDFGEYYTEDEVWGDGK